MDAFAIFAKAPFPRESSVEEPPATGRSGAALPLWGSPASGRRIPELSDASPSPAVRSARRTGVVGCVAIPAVRSARRTGLSDASPSPRFGPPAGPELSDASPSPRFGPPAGPEFRRVPLSNWAKRAAIASCPTITSTRFSGRCCSCARTSESSTRASARTRSSSARRTATSASTATSGRVGSSRDRVVRGGGQQAEPLEPLDGRGDLALVAVEVFGELGDVAAGRRQQRPVCLFVGWLHPHRFQHSIRLSRLLEPGGLLFGGWRLLAMSGIRQGSVRCDRPLIGVILSLPGARGPDRGRPVKPQRARPP